jgi:hypothetical protein
MKHCLRSVLALVFIAAFGVTAAHAQNASASCDRACLKTMLDQYLNAVLKHDPAGLPLVVGFRQTENAINVRPPNGVWKSVTALGKVQRRYFDPVTGQAGFFGLVDEGSEQAIVTLRLRIENRKMTEAEWYLARPGDPGLNGPRQPGGRPANNFNAEYLTANPPPDRVVPKAQRSTREELLAIVNSYFDAITSHDGGVALTHQGCGRVENGSPTPGGSFLPPATPVAGGAPRAGAPAGAAGAVPAAPGGAPPGARQGGGPPAGGAPNTPGAGGGGRQGRGGGGGDCVGSLQNFNLSMVTGRRIPLVDEEAQMVLATAVFIRRPGSPTPRNVFSEWFMVDEGKIRIVWAAMFYPPPELAVPNWPPYEGNWPLPAGVVPTPAAPPAGRQ